MRIRGFLLLASALALLGVGCDVPSGLLSDEERNSLYALDVSLGSKSVEAGDALPPGSTLSLSLATLSGAKNPDSLSLDLVDSSGATTATLSYSSLPAAKAAQADTGALAVSSLVGKLPAFSLPAGLKPGYYSLRSSVFAAGTQVQQGSLEFFVPSPDWELGGVTFSPSVPRASGEVLLSASILSSAGAGAVDPASAGRLWLRWSQGSRVLAEGPLSKGYDRVVWDLPPAEGAYAVRLDFYPGPPPGDSYQLSSPWNQTISFIARAAVPDKFLDPFASPTRWSSLFTFDGGIADSGNRPATRAPLVIGQPSLVAFPGGFGERLGPAQGFSVSELGFNPADKGGAFSIALRLSVESGNGNLFALGTADGGVLSLGLEEGALGLAYPGMADPGQRLEPELSLSPGPHDLLLSFIPRKDGYELVWTLDGTGHLRSSLPAFSASFVSLSLGGEGSATAVWDGFGLCYDGASGPPPLLASSLFRLEGGRLFAATGFESQPGSDFSLSGKSRLQGLSLALDDGASIATSRALPTASGLRISASLRSGGLRLELRKPDGSLFLSVSGGGELRDAGGSRLGNLGEGKRAFELSLSLSDKGIELRGQDGLVLSLQGELPEQLRPLVVSEGGLSLESLSFSSLLEPGAKTGS